ncbi:MAG: hypothetical protein CL912_14445 [Deltaproteobacteria bacterium]|nr:hypothetical protein [Deltaproteobacteria bacterium]
MSTDRQNGGIPGLDGTFDDQRNTQRNGHVTETERTAGPSHGGSRTGGYSFRNSALSLISRNDERPSDRRTRSNGPMRGAMRGGMNAEGGYQLN